MQFVFNPKSFLFKCGPNLCWNKRGSDITQLSFDDNKGIYNLDNKIPKNATVELKNQWFASFPHISCLFIY
jgi:hypothetical protein